MQKQANAMLLGILGISNAAKILQHKTHVKIIYDLMWRKNHTSFETRLVKSIFKSINPLVSCRIGAESTDL